MMLKKEKNKILDPLLYAAQCQNLMGSWHMLHPATKFQRNWSTCFGVKLLKGRQTKNTWH